MSIESEVRKIANRFMENCVMSWTRFVVLFVLFVACMPCRAQLFMRNASGQLVDSDGAVVTSIGGRPLGAPVVSTPNYGAFSYPVQSVPQYGSVQLSQPAYRQLTYSQPIYSAPVAHRQPLTVQRRAVQPSTFGMVMPVNTRFQQMPIFNQIRATTQSVCGPNGCQ